MEITNVEVTAIDNTLTVAKEQQLRELSEIQLALVGGGIGDVVFG